MRAAIAATQRLQARRRGRPAKIELHQKNLPAKRLEGRCFAGKFAQAAA